MNSTYPFSACGAGVLHDGLDVDLARRLPGLAMTNRSSTRTAGTQSRSTEPVMPPWLKMAPAPNGITLQRRAVWYRLIPSIGSVVGLSTRTTRRFFAPGLTAAVTSSTNGVSPPFVPADGRPVEPDLGQVVDLPETQQAPPAGMRVRPARRTRASTRRRRDSRERRPG